MAILSCGTLVPHFTAAAGVALLGNNAPYRDVNDGAFDLTPGWEVHDSPHWTVNKDLSKGRKQAGVAKGVFTGAGNPLTVVESRVLDNIPAYPSPIAGNVLKWRFAAKAEFPCKALVTMSLVFGEHVRAVAAPCRAPSAAAEPAVFEGSYTITAEDAAAGMPFVRIALENNKHTQVFLHYVDLSVRVPEVAGPEQLSAEATEQGIRVHWSDEGRGRGPYAVYRKSARDKQFNRIAGDLQSTEFLDTAFLDGLDQIYLVTQVRDGHESTASPQIRIRKVDDTPPRPPANVAATALDTTVDLQWQSEDNDIDTYTILRGDADGGNMYPIADGIRQTKFTDLLPPKSVDITYRIQATDFSGNTSELSEPVRVKVKAVHGASFSDLILPMPIHKELRSDLWGAPNVLPRDPDNGIEHPDWSYWGGRPMKDKDGKYHMLVVRWPEKARKGHWEWVNSTVVHSVSDTPTGPYIPTGPVAYDYHGGHGHNADVTVLNDGRFLLYSLIDWKPTLMTSDSMRGPWKVEGEMVVEYNEGEVKEGHEYRLQRNLSGLQLDDGNMLFVTKAGNMMRSESGLLGPYKVLTADVNANKTIPERFRNSNYEDPVMWRDEVQFHMLINAFLDYRAIYLRSQDGIHWKCDTGLAYTPDSTRYVDGTRTRWHKLERPHVLQDEYGRATHLSLAAIPLRHVRGETGPAPKRGSGAELRRLHGRPSSNKSAVYAVQVRQAGGLRLRWRGRNGHAAGPVEGRLRERKVLRLVRPSRYADSAQRPERTQRDHCLDGLGPLRDLGRHIGGWLHLGGARGGGATPSRAARRVAVRVDARHPGVGGKILPLLQGGSRPQPGEPSWCPHDWPGDR